MEEEDLAFEFRGLGFADVIRVVLQDGPVEDEEPVLPVLASMPELVKPTTLALQKRTV